MNEKRFEILLVEDNAADAHLFRKALETANLNFELTVLTDGEEALAFVRREGRYANVVRPDLAIMDLNLPKSDGAEVLAALRNSQEFSNVLVVVASSSSYPRDNERVTQLGIARYIRKPTDLEDFLHIGLILKDILLEQSAKSQ
jgi:CheY-like chemotaxis protein